MARDPQGAVAAGCRSCASTARTGGGSGDAGILKLDDNPAELKEDVTTSAGGFVLSEGAEDNIRSGRIVMTDADNADSERFRMVQKTRTRTIHTDDVERFQNAITPLAGFFMNRFALLNLSRVPA